MTMLPKRFLADPKSTHETLKWVIIIEVVTTIIFVIAMANITGKEPKVAIDPELTQEMRKANAEYRQALEKSDAERIKTVELLQRRDSLIQAELHHDRNELKNERKKHNEKLDRIDRYVTDDILREFSKLTADSAQ
ncbi:MAG TPA: hypothetical protein PLS87_11675 [Ferruginibacter sp.]|nr:hypothetical protein [Ferruginibacter sp.]